MCRIVISSQKWLPKQISADQGPERLLIHLPSGVRPILTAVIHTEEEFDWDKLTRRPAPGDPKPPPGTAPSHLSRTT